MQNMVDDLAKQGVEMVVPLFAYTMVVPFAIFLLQIWFLSFFIFLMLWMVFLLCLCYSFPGVIV